MNNKSKEFKALQNEWYDKLEQNGFKDIEQDEEHLNKSSIWFYSRYGHEKFQSKEFYYQLAGQFLYEHKFEDETHKKIWQLHSEGVAGREIAKQVKSLKKSAVYLVIDELKEEMISKYIGATSEQK